MSAPLGDILEISLAEMPFESRLHRILEVTTRSSLADLEPQGGGVPGGSRD